MSFSQQRIIPAIRNSKQLELFLQSPLKYGVLLDTHISQLTSIMDMSSRAKKILIIHADLIHGLNNDEYATEYLCQEYKPYGIISTRLNVITKAKQKGVKAILRVFLLDSHALDKTYALLAKASPDYIEVLPGTLTNTIKEISSFVNIPILAGGFIRTIEDVEHTINAGAIAVTTSKVDLWESRSLFRNG